MKQARYWRCPYCLGYLPWGTRPVRRHLADCWSRKR